MKRIFNRQKTKTIELNMTSMIDVIFLLLIFFIFTANFDAVEKLLPTNLQLPGSLESVAPSKPQEEQILGEILIKIFVEKNALSWSVNQRTCSSLLDVGQILNDLAEVDAQIPVIIDPQRTLPIENVLDVYDLCRQCQLKNIQFAASPNALTGI